MKSLIIASLVFMMTLSHHVYAQSKEELSYDEIKSCNDFSLRYEREESRLHSEQNNLHQQSQSINSLDSKLTGLDWDYNNAYHSLEMCRVQNNNNDSYCRYEFNRVDSLAQQFNETISLIKRKNREYNNRADRFNADLTNFNRMQSRFDSQCFNKSFDMDDVNAVCGNSNTIFCNSIRPE